MAKDYQKLMDLIEDEYGNVQDYFQDSVQPGVCVECHTVHDSCEPDMDGGDMGCCHGSHVIALEQLLMYGAVPTFDLED